jgi:two-component system chemotaxis sensor kinase CheA
VFTTLNEAVDLRSSIKNILVIIGLSGVLISLILTLLFTDKLRRQISDLGKATELIKTGDFNNKILIKSKDEIGKLTTAFNLMATELEKNQRSKNEYSDFITMLNQNPSLKEISDAALGKIISICGFVAGTLYTVEEDSVKIASSYGIEMGNSSVNSNFINSVIDKRELRELRFDENPPSIRIGSIEIDLKYLTLVPIIYNTKVIAVLELSGTNQPKDESRDYLNKIQEHLAIGLANAIAFAQLEKLVIELKHLNEDYQTQNIQIRKQNETLIDLHKKLKEKAEELEFQKQKAEESTKLKSQFLASMSHELRTPMNSILGLTELMLEQGNIKGKDRERIGVVLSSGKRLMGLIDDILDLSKIEAGKMEIHKEDVLLEELIKEVEHSISPLFKDKKIDFRIIKDTSTSIIINTDRGKVTQVLINLLGNAIKFTEAGYVEFKISSAENKTLIFSITDSGIGIADNDQKVIFDEFRQVDGTSTKRYSGTGLGLAICKKIASLLQGSISVSSKLGIGSSFTFIIPLHFVEKIEKEGPPPILAIDNNPGPWDTMPDVNKEAFSGEENILIEEIKVNYIGRVLVVDDDPDTLFTINEILESCNCKTYLVKGGKECLNILEQITPDIILLDIMMPEMDGFQTINKIRMYPKWEHIPIFAVTAKAMLEDKEVILRNGFDDYVPKPINAAILSMKIKKVFMNLKLS